VIIINVRLNYLLLALIGIVTIPAYAQEAIQLQTPAIESHPKLIEKKDVPPEPIAEAQAEGYVELPIIVRIDRFVVKGNTLLPTSQIEHLLEPFKGKGRTFADIQYALEALEGAYRTAGYSAVHVVTPEQKITEGTITFEVIENVIARVVINGNQYYDKKNIRNALPGLVEGSTPGTRELSRNIQLANQNPTRQVDLVLAMGEEENTVDAKINVQDSSPHKFFLTLDNTGNQSTGMYRTGVGYQNNNLFNRDQALALNYITSPNHLADVRQYSASYRIPVYSLGDSIDLLAAHSSTNTGSLNLGSVGSMAVTSQGDTYGAHYNHNLARRGDYTSKFIFGFDSRLTLQNCAGSNAQATSAGCASIGDVDLLPFTLAYGGTLTKPAKVTDYSVSAVHNFPIEKKGNQSYFDAVSYGRNLPDDYNILHLNGSVSGVLTKDWQYRLVGNVQYANALLASEQLSLAGANAVRGFIEHEFANDRGYFVNLELYTPELAQTFKLKDGSLRFLGFVDSGAGWNKITNPADTSKRTTLGSVGVGFRYNSGKHLTVKFDLAKVTCADNDGVTCDGGVNKTGDTHGQISVLGSW